ncbi:MAG: HlyD family efflux transporter periplasmic adaptor subunit [Planctomycetes bacterium]|nr:HlyD family efflux transporter periplasmic adaptor subunit [Planctomycetota bacterium]
MIDLTKLQAPGWRRVVAELSAEAPDDRAFLARLLAVLGQVCGARQATLFAVSAGDQGEDAPPRRMLVWPTTTDAAPGQPESLEDESEVLSAVRAAGESGSIRVFGLETDSKQFYEGTRGRGYVVAVPVVAVEIGLGLRPVIGLVLDARSEQALQATLAQLEMLAGYSATHAARQHLKRTREAGAALDLAGQLIASINAARGYKGAVLQVVNDLSRHLKADRVSLGWTRGDNIRVAAISDTEHIDHRLAMVRKLQAAMEECLDQAHAVMHPAPRQDQPDAQPDPLLARAITHAHRELAAADVSLKVASLPLRRGDDTLGVVTIESTGEGVIDAKTIELIQATLDLIAPVIEVRKSDDRPLPVRAKDATIKAGQWIVGPRHTVWKLVSLAVLALLVTITVVHVPYRVEASMQLRAREQRQIAVPFDGVLKSVPEHIKPGARVNAGDVLFVLDTHQLELQALGARAGMEQARTEADAARRAGKDDEEAQARHRADQARFELDLHEYQIRRATVTAPITGTIVQGDLAPLVGSTVKLGDPLMRVAQLDDMIAVARVDDSDIRLVQEAIRRANEGGPQPASAIATKARPSETFRIRVTHIIPLAQPEEGVNAFEVRADLIDPPATWMRPGMEGIARLDTGKRSILSIGTRRISDTLRLWFWR